MDEELMIKQFLQAGAEEINDSGFSERVMRHVSNEKPFWLVFIAVVLAVAALVLMFIAFDGWAYVCNFVTKACSIAAYATHFYINPIYILVFIGLITWCIIEKVKVRA